MSWDPTVLSESLAQATGCRPCGAAEGLAALGRVARGARLEALQDSPNWNGRRFQNPIATPRTLKQPTNLAREFAFGGAEREPREPLPIITPERGSLAAGGGEALRITWLGHSSVLLEIDGHLVLTDPVFGPRAAPVSWMGPRRFHPPPVPPERLPPLDAVLISHDHYDHLDTPTIRALIPRVPRWVTSLGVGAHLEAWGVPPERIVELDWWQETRVGDLRLVATPARHFSGRAPDRMSTTFWSSWVLEGPKHRLWFSGDTGPWEEAFRDIGERFGGFDLTLIEIGAWNASWASVHLGPDAAVRTHQQVRGRTMMPVHWGTFNLALHPWDQPICRVQELAETEGIQLLSPLMGQTVHREFGVAPYWQGRRG